MALLEVKDPTTGQIKPWVWVVGAGFAIGGAALFLSSGSGNSGATDQTTGEGLGTGGSLDSLDAALQQLLGNLDNMQPHPPGGTGGGSGTGTGTGTGTGSGVTTGGQTVKGVPLPAGTINTRPIPVTGSITPRPTPTTGTRTSATSGIPTTSPSGTGVIGVVSTGRTAIPTGSINPYPISRGINRPKQLGSLQTLPFNPT